jgi:hypothetical protein
MKAVASAVVTAEVAIVPAKHDVAIITASKKALIFFIIKHFLVKFKFFNILSLKIS